MKQLILSLLCLFIFSVGYGQTYSGHNAIPYHPTGKDTMTKQEQSVWDSLTNPLRCMYVEDYNKMRDSIKYLNAVISSDLYAINDMTQTIKGSDSLWEGLFSIYCRDMSYREHQIDSLQHLNDSLKGALSKKYYPWRNGETYTMDTAIAMAWRYLPNDASKIWFMPDGTFYGSHVAPDGNGSIKSDTTKQPLIYKKVKGHWVKIKIK